ncbi:solute carrier family 35 member E1, variant [Capsaspora owczarzaki ATCC 30864]|uniref:Solute carrier family 35 member E1 n=1 Tax=Capsaspora owczarzaki (strain ATCC 30864) TaxID=595528 RepID=E9CH19_CAPO3|nr:solute carrier family 35 member E1 [Capsaspora owczarzaki ATCC 30864]XP_011270742.1 solute carrier family 35 member E1, variant [Capsaspora owczarzaki ATCC 30864]KJE96983.1 solute carrier family 35 member E1 [Capsaspora owczarzaki ATCC 30864]|eukprot:XP_004343347.2 solute carrier family 35 member E1 [Capsaspora owczarzaki ATCC 30864]
MIDHGVPHQLTTSASQSKLDRHNAAVGIGTASGSHAQTAAVARQTVVHVVGICVLWFLSSALTNNVGKTVLMKFPFPTTVTMTQQLVITFCMYLTLYVFRLHPRQPISMSQYRSLILPLSLAKILTSISSHVSLWLVPVSYAHTIKAIAPIFAVIFSVLILRERHSMKTYISLVPIILGVLLATVTELEFNFIGMLAAIFSMMILSLQNIYSKKLFKEKKFDHFNLLYYTSLVSCLIIVPIWLVTDARAIMHWYSSSESERLIAASGHAEDTFMHGTAEVDAAGISVPYLLGQLTIDGLCNFAQSITAFSLLFIVSPVSYSVANNSKRIVIIAAGLFTFRNPVTWANVLGMFLAILGVGLYNKAKLEGMGDSSSKLPTHHKRGGSDGPTLRMDADTAAISSALLTQTPSSDIPLTMLDRQEHSYSVWHGLKADSNFGLQAQQHYASHLQYNSNGASGFPTVTAAAAAAAAASSASSSAATASSGASVGMSSSSSSYLHGGSNHAYEPYLRPSVSASANSMGANSATPRMNGAGGSYSSGGFGSHEPKTLLVST